MPSPKSPTKPKSESNHFRFEAIGTQWDIEIHDHLDDATASALLTVILKRIAVFDKHYSRFRDDSLVADIARHAGIYKLPADAKPMLDLYLGLYHLTDGAMTPLIGQTLSDAGYDADYSLRPGTMKQPPRWDDVLDYQFPKLTTKAPALLDFGAAGKGYLIDIVTELISSRGVHSFCVDAGGDMVYKSSEIHKVGLENPDNTAEVIGVANIKNQALCGSAGNRRRWDKFHHIIDPRTLASPHHIRALWVVADSALLADGLATALFFVPAKKLAERYTFEYAVVHENHSLERSANFPATFF